MPDTETESIEETATESAPKMELREREISAEEDLNLAPEPELEEPAIQQEKPVKKKVVGLGLIVVGVALLVGG